MKNKMEKIAVLFFASALIGMTASTVFAGKYIGPDDPGWPPPVPGPWTDPGSE